MSLKDHTLLISIRASILCFSYLEFLNIFFLATLQLSAYFTFRKSLFAIREDTKN